MSAHPIDIYAAVPYSDPNPAVREYRFREATKYAAALVQAGYTVYSPITHSHPMAVANPALGLGWEYWKRHDEAYMPICAALHVLMLPGWGTSSGVAAEVRAFEAVGKLVEYVRPKDS